MIDKFQFVELRKSELMSAKKQNFRIFIFGGRNSMTELEKCMSGEWYDCHDRIFLDMKKTARDLIKQYNSFSYDQKKEKKNL